MRANPTLPSDADEYRSLNAAPFCPRAHGAFPNCGWTFADTGPSQAAVEKACAAHLCSEEHPLAPDESTWALPGEAPTAPSPAPVTGKRLLRAVVAVLRKFHAVRPDAGQHAAEWTDPPTSPDALIPDG